MVKVCHVVFLTSNEACKSIPLDDMSACSAKLSCLLCVTCCLLMNFAFTMLSFTVQMDNGCVSRDERFLTN